MRTVVIILAIIGGVFLATIVGCVGCIGAVAYWASTSVPDHFNKADIYQVYQEPIREVAQVLADGKSPAYPAHTFADAVVAIFPDQEDAGGFDSDRNDYDLYGRHAIERNGHSLFNGVGALTLSVDGGSGIYAAYTIQANGRYWLLALRDWKPALAEDANPTSR